MGQWQAVCRKDGDKIDHYQKGDDAIKVVYKTQGLSTETNEVLWYKRDGVYYLDLSKAMDDTFHATNHDLLVR